MAGETFEIAILVRGGLLERRRRLQCQNFFHCRDFTIGDLHSDPAYGRRTPRMHLCDRLVLQEGLDSRSVQAQTQQVRFFRFPKGGYGFHGALSFPVSGAPPIRIEQNRWEQRPVNMAARDSMFHTPR